MKALNNITYSVKKDIGVITGLTGALIVVVVLLVIPAYRSYQDSLRRSAKMQLQLDKLTTKLSDLQGVDFNDIVNIADRFQTAIPDKNRYLAIYNGIRSLADRNNVIVTDFLINPGSVDKTTEGKDVGDKPLTIVLQLAIEGTLTAIRQFINGVEYSLPITTVTNLSFDNNQISSVSGNLQPVEAKLDLISYWIRTPTYLSDYEMPIPRLSEKNYQIYQKLLEYQVLEDLSLNNQVVEDVAIGRNNPFPI